MSLLHVLLLAVTQGLAELLPVSSSAHVIVVERLLGLDPSSPEMTFLLVMLHSGTMGAVIIYFWPRWRLLWSGASHERRLLLGMVGLASVVTGVIGYSLKHLLEKAFLNGGEIEELFGNLHLISASLFLVGLLILVAGLPRWGRTPAAPKTLRRGFWVGAIQGLCLPFRGFSRSGATISTGLLMGWEKSFSEEFSFILALVLTPPVVLREGMRLIKAQRISLSEGGPSVFDRVFSAMGPGLLGLVMSFVAGWFAIHWLSRWLESGRWSYFGIYCLVFSVLILIGQNAGYL